MVMSSETMQIFAPIRKDELLLKDILFAEVQEISFSQHFIC